MKIDLLDLDCDIKYNFEPASIGGAYPDGEIENIPPTLTLYSIVYKEVEIISWLSEDQISEIEEKLLEERLTF